MLKLILAKDELNAIGYNGDMPWGREYPEDLDYFAKNTAGDTVVMGRETFLSLKRPQGLSNRTNIVISSKPLDVKRNVTVMTIEAFRAYLKKAHYECIWVIGGKRMYEEFIYSADEIHITEIPGMHTADTFVNFNINEYSKFVTHKRLKLPHNEKSNLTLGVNILKRK